MPRSPTMLVIPALAALVAAASLQTGARETPTLALETPMRAPAWAFAERAVASARPNIVIEEAAILGINARVLGEAKPIPAHMVEVTQQRRDPFAAMGVQRAGDN